MELVYYKHVIGDQAASPGLPSKLGIHMSIKTSIIKSNAFPGGNCMAGKLQRDIHSSKNNEGCCDTFICFEGTTSPHLGERAEAQQDIRKPVTLLARIGHLSTKNIRQLERHGQEFGKGDPPPPLW